MVAAGIVAGLLAVLPGPPAEGAARKLNPALVNLPPNRWLTLHEPSATLPVGCEMRCSLEYDPHHKVLLLVTGGYGRPTAVRALRIELPR